MFFTILYFFTILISGGILFSMLFDVKKDKIYMIFSTGLIFSCFEILLLGYLRVISWVNLLLLQLLLLGFVIFFKKFDSNFFKFKFSKKEILIFLILLVIISVQFFVMYKGSHSYNHLEDGDPWIHAQGVRYVSENHHFLQEFDENIHYLAPYTPIFTSLASVLFDVESNPIIDILKMFNSLLIALGVFLAFGFFRKITNGYTALGITGMLVALPSYMSHFIWAQSLGFILFFPALYFIFSISRDSSFKEMLLTVFAIAAVLITQPSNAFIFGLITIIYFLVRLFSHEFNFKGFTIEKKLFLTLLFGLILSLIVFWVPMFLTYGSERVGSQIGFANKGMFSGTNNVDTSGGQIYSFKEIVFPAESGKIDQQIGIGSVVFIFMILGFIYYGYKFFKGKKQSSHVDAFMCLFLIFSFLGIQGNALPYKLFPHRFWVILSVPVAYFAGKFIIDLLLKIKTLVIADGKKDFKISAIHFKILLLIVIIFLVYTTSFSYKYAVQTSAWPEHRIMVPEITNFYLNSGIPHNSKVLFLCKNQIANGLNFNSEDWRPEVTNFKDEFFNSSNQEISTFLTNYNYEYIAVDLLCFQKDNKSVQQVKFEKLNSLGIKPLKQSTSKLAILYKI